jgi:hypothetical protein
MTTDMPTQNQSKISKILIEYNIKLSSDATHATIESNNSLHHIVVDQILVPTELVEFDDPIDNKNIEGYFILHADEGHLLIQDHCISAPFGHQIIYHKCSSSIDIDEFISLVDLDTIDYQPDEETISDENTISNDETPNMRGLSCHNPSIIVLIFVLYFIIRFIFFYVQYLGFIEF